MQVLERPLPSRLAPTDAATLARATGGPAGGDNELIRSWSPERVEFLTDVLVAGASGWAGYWSTGEGPISYWSTGEDRWLPDRGRTRAPQRIGLADLATALNNREALAKYVGSVALVRIGKANRENNAGLLDADDCDAIFHIALLGEVVYA